MASWLQDAWYWLHSPKESWLACQFVSQNGDVVTLKTQEGEHYDVPASSPLRPALASSLKPTSNLAELEELFEGAILNTLRMRYAENEIYTHINSIIVSINPYKQLAIYGPSQIAAYRKSAVLRQQQSQQQSAAAQQAKNNSSSSSSPAPITTSQQVLPPHLYALADDVYTALIRDRTNQAILISGESGAGKTECAKLCLQYLAEVAGQEAQISQQILEANPILESFGNARTIRNNNSSRFGKWIEIEMDLSGGSSVPTGAGNINSTMERERNAGGGGGNTPNVSSSNSARIVGARIDNYLLEKTRVVHQVEGERNYHAFYQLCSTTDVQERKTLFLPPITELQLDDSGGGASSSSSITTKTASHFRILTRGNTLTNSGQNDHEDYLALKQAMSILHFEEGDIGGVMRILAAILHLGNVEFEKEVAGATGATSTAAKSPTSSSASSSSNEDRHRITSPATTLHHACTLLSINPETLTRSLLTRQLRLGHGEIITVLNNATACKDNRDMLCKSLYETLFLHILYTINETLTSQNVFIQSKIIGVLDIFGFESDHTNFFEQLLINFANEKLNQHFLEHVFKSESLLYHSEGLAITDISYQDHSACLALLEEKRIGIIDMIAEEVRLPKGSDENLLQRMHDSYAPNPHQPSKNPTLAPINPSSLVSMSSYYIRSRTKDSCFSIRHYAGDVKYSIEGFLEKAKDSLPEALGQCIESSTNPMVARLLEKKQVQQRMQMTGSLDYGRGSVVVPRASISPSNAAAMQAKNAGASLSPNSANSDRSPGPIPSPKSGRLLSPSPQPSPTLRPAVPMSSRVSTTQQSSSSSSSQSSSSSGKYGLTLGGQFRVQLSDLLTTLNSCSANFIRCLKPNEAKISESFNSIFVLKQLQYLGIKGVIEMRQQTFSVRMKYREFLKRYYCILTKGERKKVEVVLKKANQLTPDGEEQEESKEATAQYKSLSSSLLSTFIPSSYTSDYRFGSTLLFFRPIIQSILESRRDSFLIETIVRIQTACRASVARRRYHGVKVCMKELKEKVKEVEKMEVASLSSNDLTPLSKVLDSLNTLLLTSESTYFLPPSLLQPYRTVHQRGTDLVAVRTMLQQAVEARDVNLLRSGVGKAKQMKQLAASPQVKQAEELLSRLEKYLLARQQALEQRTLPLLEAIVKESRSLGNMNQQEDRDCILLYDRLLLESTLTTELESLLKTRGPLEKLQVALNKATDAGMLGSKQSNNTVYRATTLAALLQKEITLLKNLEQSIQSKQLVQIEGLLHEYSSDAGLSQSLASHPLIVQAKSMRATIVNAAALASERLATLKSSFKGGNISFIKASLQEVRSLDKSALDSLGADGVKVQKDAEDLLAKLSVRNEVQEKLKTAMDERAVNAIKLALDHAKQSGVTLSDIPEYQQAEKLLTSLQQSTSSLEAALKSESLETVDRALNEAKRVGLVNEALLTNVQQHRIRLLQISNLSSEIKTALKAGQRNDLTSLQTLLKRAQAAGMSEAKYTEVRDLKKAVEEMEKKSSTTTAATSSTTSSTGPKPTAVPSVASKSGNKLSTPASLSQPTKEEKSSSLKPHDVYRAKTYHITLYPGLRSVQDYYRERDVNQRIATIGGTLGGSKDSSRTPPTPSTPTNATPNTTAKMLTWSRDGLLRSLTSFPPHTDDSMISLACELFRTIQGWCGDRMYSFHETLGLELLQKGITYPLVRNEIFIQMCKQLTNNPNIESTKKLWQLYGLTLETFQPSAELKPFLFNFLLEYYDNTIYHSRAYVLYCLKLMTAAGGGSATATNGSSSSSSSASSSSSSSGSTKPITAPTLEHVLTFRERIMGQRDLSIFFPDNSRIILKNIDSTMSTEACAKMVCKQIGLVQCEGDRNVFETWGIFHVNATPAVSSTGVGGLKQSSSPPQPQEPTYITPTECLLDYPASKVNDEHRDRTTSAYFLFQKRVWPGSLNEEFKTTLIARAAFDVDAPMGVASETKQQDSSSSSSSSSSSTKSPFAASPTLQYESLSPCDQISCTILYYQLLTRVFLLPHYVVTKEEVVELQAQHRRLMEKKVFQRVGEHDGRGVISVFPPLPSTASAAELSSIQSAITTATNSLPLTSATPFRALTLFLPSSTATTNTRPHLGYQSYEVQNTEIPILPQTLCLGVTTNGFYIIDAKTKEILKAYQLKHLSGWASNSIKFSLRVLIGKGRTQQLNFECANGKRIVVTLQEMVQRIVEKQKIMNHAAAAAAASASSAAKASSSSTTVSMNSKSSTSSTTSSSSSSPSLSSPQQSRTVISVTPPLNKPTRK